MTDSRRTARPRQAAPALLLASGLAAVATLAIVWAWRLPDPSVLLPIPWWGLLAGFFVAERAVFRLHVRSGAQSISLRAAPLVVGLFTTSPIGLVGAQLLGVGAALALRRRQRWLRGTIDVVHAALGSAVGVVVFRSLVSGHDPFHAVGWLAALAAAAAAGLATLAAGRVDELLGSRRVTSGELRVAVALSLVGSLTTASLAVAVTTLAESRPSALFLLILPAAAFVLIVRDYVSGRRSHDHLQWFYDWAKRRNDQDLDSGLRQLLLSACRLLHADYAEILLLPLDSRERALRSSLGPDRELLIERTEISAAEEGAIEAIRLRGGLVRLAADSGPAALRGYPADRGLRDLTVTTLEGESALLGLLFVGDRGDELSTFGHEDERLFRTFAGHAALLLENEQLEQSLAKLTDLEAKLRHQALHDALTGLPNRRLFHARVDEALQRAEADGSEPVVLFLDLDGFKAINDDLGHAAGDELLVAFAERLRGNVRPEELPARLGGDEFAVLIESGGRDVAEDVAQRLVVAVRNPFSIQGRRLSVRLSIGIAAASSSRGVEDMLANADLAMYAAKADGTSSYALYSARMRGSAEARKLLGEALEEALERDQIAVHYQPIIDLRTGATVAFEALARWRRGRADTVPAADFLPAAEEEGELIERIGKVVMRAACMQTQEWRSESDPARELSVCVNLSPAEFSNPRLGVDVAAALLDTGLDASRLILEITEQVATDDSEAALKTMSDLRRLGVRFALDGFGTGGASLEQLCQLPFDVLKIARPLVERIEGGPAEERVTRAIVGLGKSLGLKVVAEGIETKAQGVLLQQLGCPLGQGFFFDQALSVSQATRRLRTAPSAHLRLVAADTA